MTATTTRAARWAAVRAGLFRGWIETRHASAIEVLVPAIMVAVILLVLGDRTVAGTDFSLAAMVLPGFLAFAIASGGFTGPLAPIAADAEDGTLLRAKATPNGMLAYVVGKVVTLALKALVGLVVVLVPGMLVAGARAGALVFDARTWLLLALIFVAGMLATVPLGLALGSLMKSSMHGGLSTLVTAPLIAASVFLVPLTILPTWLQWVAQALPFYWIGLGARSALLPSAMAASEIGASWRTLETFAALGLWAAIGLLLAPILLRRMARRQSGATVAATRQRVMSRGY